MAPQAFKEALKQSLKITQKLVLGQFNLAFSYLHVVSTLLSCKAALRGVGVERLGKVELRMQHNEGLWSIMACTNMADCQRS